MKDPEKTCAKMHVRRLQNGTAVTLPLGTAEPQGAWPWRATHKFNEQAKEASGCCGVTAWRDVGARCLG